MDNFRDSFIRPIITKFVSGQRNDINTFIEALGTKLGIGDDVSLGIITLCNK